VLPVVVDVTILGRDLDSTSHHSHMLHCDMMEKVLIADTGKIYLSSLQYCCSLHSHSTAQSGRISTVNNAGWRRGITNILNTEASNL